MSTYRIKGARFLRKYTESGSSPVYAASIQAQTVANSLCSVPWERVSADTAQMTLHTSEAVSGTTDGFDYNVEIRDKFDAALFCAGHTGGMHRAYANGAVYRYEIPQAARGLSLTALTARVSTDPYNAGGVRMHIWTDSTGEIPMACAAVRGNDSSGTPLTDGTTLAAQCKRVTVTSGSTSTWYPNTADVTFSPTTALVLGKYLYLSVLLESYSTVRGNYLEGSSFIKNDVEITLSEETEALDADSLNDLSIGETPDYSLPVLKDGVTVDLTGTVSGVVSVVMTSSGITPVLDDERHVDDLTRIVDNADPDNIVATVRNVYRRFLTSDVDLADFASCNPRKRPCGVGFCVHQSSDIPFVNAAGETSTVRTVALTASSLLVPFSIPSSYVVSHAKIDWTKWLTGRSPTSASKFTFWFKAESVTSVAETTVKSPALYRGTSDEVDGWTLMGQTPVTDGAATLPLPAFTGQIGTILIAAWIDQDSITDTSSDFDIGSAPFAYNGVTADSALPVSKLYYPVFDPKHSYVAGESVRHVDAASVAFEKLTPTMSPANLCVGKDVVVGVASSKFVYSGDGVHFYASEMEVTEDLSGIYYFDDRFIALSGSYVYQSSDGVRWTRSANEFTVNGTVYSLLSLAYSGSRWLAGCGETILYSDDGETWNATGVSGSVAEVAFCGSFYIANVDGVVQRSADGASWATVSSAPVAFLAGSVAYSSGGAAFLSDELNPVLYATSDKGLNWTAGTSYDDDTGVVGVEYAFGVWVVVTANATYRCTSSQPSAFYKVSETGGTFLAHNGSYFIKGDGSMVACSALGNGWVDKDISGFAPTFTPVAIGSAWLSTTNRKVTVFDDNVSRTAYTASAAHTGSFSTDYFTAVESPVKDRLVGYDGLCFPDVTLIG